jgi:hypothetical protein
MAKYLNICGNYKISVTDGGTITLDTGSAVGEVIITGNLTVQGTTTTVDTATLVIEDRIITLNNGGSSGGQISDIGGQQRAGIEIDRGGIDTYWLFDENINTESAGPGAWVGLDASNNIIGIRTTSIDTAGTDLYLINQGSGVVTVEGCNLYQEKIFEYKGTVGNRIVDFDASPVLKADAHDTLVNAKAVVDYLDGFFVGRFQTRIEKDDSYVAVHDTDLGDAVSAIEFTIDGNPAAYFFNDRTELQHIRIQDTKIETTSSNTDLILAAPGAGSVRIDDTLLLTPVPHTDDAGPLDPFQGYDADTDNPDAPDAGVKIYNKPEGPAGSGVYFVNNSETKDELVSKKKSILFSMIF